jgi:hypothetical protein
MRWNLGYLVWIKTYLIPGVNLGGFVRIKSRIWFIWGLIISKRRANACWKLKLPFIASLVLQRNYKTLYLNTVYNYVATRKTRIKFCGKFLIPHIQTHPHNTTQFVIQFITTKFNHIKTYISSHRNKRTLQPIYDESASNYSFIWVQNTWRCLRRGYWWYIFGPKRVKVRGGWGKLLNEKLRNL